MGSDYGWGNRANALVLFENLLFDVYFLVFSKFTKSIEVEYAIQNEMMGRLSVLILPDYLNMKNPRGLSGLTALATTMW